MKNPFKKTTFSKSIAHIMRSGHFAWSFKNRGASKTYNLYRDKFETLDLMIMLVKRYRYDLIETELIGSKTESYWSNESELTYIPPKREDLSRDEIKIFDSKIKSNYIPLIKK